ncbi:MULTISPECIES: carbohydrate ABC transporter permease [Paenibacillus]|uniref:Binding-protein-dependent transport systems inner membrane component n=2 Tax=Paenibacillus lactis TaxID=228574 RepID=G4HM15_9BACL|nr:MULTISPECIES: carbohydrate ABC transporter permease [Paenibacillus]EHB56660.1 binding-protein-dependent transport systems inner membrane component [Paenibacillus lactis 154]HAG01586.1 carbohydrate ABC transporter permease [Paenibacillus lactis]
MRRLEFSKIVIYVLLFLFTLMVLVPILNLLALSLTDPGKAHLMGGLDIVPKGFTTINYQLLFANPLITGSIMNSVWITAAGTFLNLLLTSMAAYVLARTEFIGKKAVLFLLIVIMVFEPGMIPEYLLIKDLGLMNTLTSLILYKAINVYYLFILMRFIQDIPEEILEASRMDGAGHFRLYTRIILPLSKPGLATLGLFYGVYHWNEYFRATLYISEPGKWPLQVVLRQFVVRKDNTSLMGNQNMFDSAINFDFASLQAGTIIIAIVPLLFLYPFILKYYAKGELEGGVKD